MTTIAFDKTHIASDSQGTKDFIDTGVFKKLYKGEFQNYFGKSVPCVMGYTGRYSRFAPLREWFVIDGWRYLPDYYPITVRENIESGSSSDGTPLGALVVPSKSFRHADEDEFWEFVVFTPKRAFVLGANAETFIELSAPNACGSGSAFAIGAMLAGKSAKEAIKVASKCDLYTDSRVVEILRP